MHKRLTCILTGRSLRRDASAQSLSFRLVDCAHSENKRVHLKRRAWVRLFLRWKYPQLDPFG